MADRDDPGPEGFARKGFPVMILRVLKILAFMLASMVGYVWNRLTGVMGPEVWLTRQFQRWTGYVLKVFDADLDMEGTEYLAQHAGRKIIIMSNHQSQLDIPCLAKAADRLGCELRFAHRH